MLIKIFKMMKNVNLLFGDYGINLPLSLGRRNGNEYFKKIVFRQFFKKRNEWRNYRNKKMCKLSQKDRNILLSLSLL
jgi:hypothetical protein